MIASKIINHITPHTVYVEPFCGGCAVMSKKGLPEITSGDYYREVINDTNDQLITMFQELQKNEKLENRLKKTLYSRSEYMKAKQIYKTPEKYDKEDIAWAFFVNIHMSFSNRLGGGMKTSVFTRNDAFTWYNKVNAIKTIRERLKYCYIENDDCIEVINRWDSPQTFFYCDPPYPGSNNGHYDNYGLHDYKKLIEKLDNIDGSFILSCYQQGIEPDKWKRIDIKSTMSASGKGRTGKEKDRRKKAEKEKLGKTERIESIWLVDRSENVRKELKKHLWCPSLGFINRNE